VVGRGDADALRRDAGPVADRLDVLGAVDDATKAAALRSVDVFCAPNVRGESFGMVLTEAMAAGAPVLVSDLDAFRAVLGEPPAGALFRAGDARSLATGLAALLDDPARRAALADAGRNRASGFGWPVVAASVLRVYRAAVAADPRRVAPPRVS
jgi:phosphatidyl-myo-inositol alpha-mannosyltransferase